ncbi:helix-turn-helix transcriptional regulator [Sphaerotilus microaerophilus]|uniref:HTH luxR-type domain-containing protein n=1 Tax=Sphaerotilus microaerophilus TaxID=2914710 RepID=A0ABM7YM14_9BURK|nr:helix-turn-helix transcriptional regulator [Sphaerotilus sp. FB-5]BDI05437.1 hypothetical protein CATMQ487_24070 [Sphaerotilus sp. FB-5]
MNSSTRAKARFRQICTLGPGGLGCIPDLLAAVRDVVPSGPNAFLVVDQDQRCEYLTVEDCPDSVMETFRSEFGGAMQPDIDNITRFFALCQTGAYFGFEERASPGFYGRGLYHEAWRPLGQHHSMAGVVQLDGRLRGLMQLYRGSKEPAFSGQEARELGWLLPFVPRVLQASLSQGLLRVAVTRTGFVLLDRSGRVSHACENSKRMLGNLRLEYSWNNRQVEIDNGLADLATRLERIADGRPASPPEVRFGYSGGEVRFRAHGLQQALEGAEHVILATVEQREWDSLCLLRGLRTLPLSSRESDVCFWLSQGMTTALVADRMGLKPSTVKAYADSVYAKLGVSSREDLRARIMSGSLGDGPS